MLRGDPFGIVALADDLRARLDWREELVSLTLIVAESAILYLYIGVLLPEMTPPYAPISGLLLFTLLAVGYFLPHLLDEARVWSPRYEVILSIGIVLSLLLALKIAAFPHEPWLSASWIRGSIAGFVVRPSTAIRPPWGLVGVVAYVWWRGRTRAEPTLETAYGMLRWGMMAIAGGLFLVLTATPDSSPIHTRMAGAVVIYFAGALAAVGIARFRLEGLRSGSPLGPHWLATFAVPIAVIVVLAVAAAGIFSRQFLETLLVVLGPFFWLFGLVIRAFIILVALIAFVLIAPILWLLERQGLGRLPLADRLPRVGSPFAQLDQFARDTLHVADPVRYIIAGIALVAIGSLLVRYAYHRRRRWRESADELRESVFAWDDAVGGLVSRLRRLARPIPTRGDPLARLRTDPRWAHTVYIRETYAHLLRRGARAGAPRPLDATPDEHEPALARSFPEAGVEIGTITAAYDAARYSGEPASAAEAEAVRRAWERLPLRGERRRG